MASEDYKNPTVFKDPDTGQEKSEGTVAVWNLSENSKVIDNNFNVKHRVRKRESKQYAPVIDLEPVKDLVKCKLRDDSQGLSGLSGGSFEQSWLGKSLEERYDFIIEVIEALKHPFYVIDAENYSIKLANSTARQGGRNTALTCYGLSHKRDEPCDGQDHPCPLTLVKETCKPCVVEHTHFDVDGNEKVVEVHAYPICSEGRVTEVIEYSLDITERKEAEQRERELQKQLNYAQKLQSLETFSTGIAHEYNNLLTNILGRIEIALLSIDKDIHNEENLREAKKAAIRAAELTNQILAYSGRGRFVSEKVVLSDLVEREKSLLEVSTPSNINLIFNLAEDLPPIEAHINQLRQVMMNLILNASEVFEGHPGTITLSTGKVNTANITAEIEKVLKDLALGEYVWLEVSDDGPGIPEEDMGKLFDPFFSTGFTGKGLGLAAVRGIVQGHKGAISVRSKESEGAAFRVFFPCSRGGDSAAGLQFEI